MRVHILKALNVYLAKFGIQYPLLCTFLCTCTYVCKSLYIHDVDADSVAYTNLNVGRHKVKIMAACPGGHGFSKQNKTVRFGIHIWTGKIGTWLFYLLFLHLATCLYCCIAIDLCNFWTAHFLFYPALSMAIVLKYGISMHYCCSNRQHHVGIYVYKFKAIL